LLAFICVCALLTLMPTAQAQNTTGTVTFSDTFDREPDTFVPPW